MFLLLIVVGVSCTALVPAWNDHKIKDLNRLHRHISVRERERGALQYILHYFVIRTKQNYRDLKKKKNCAIPRFLVFAMETNKV